MFHRCTYRRFTRFFLLASCIAAAGLAQAASFRVTTPADGGAGSLRQAITDANASPGFDGISFAIDPMASGPGPWTIALRSPLPPIKDRIAMSGFSQPGSRPGFPAQPMIEIDTAGMACNANNDFGSALAFVRGSERSLVSGLAIVGSSAGCSGAAILVLADGVKVVANRFGVRANGDVVGLGGVSAGVGVLMSRDAVIGDPDPDNGNIFAGIDPIAIADIREMVRDLKSRDIGVLITDHNVRETLDIVDRACIIYDGQVLFQGTPQALVADQEVRRLYLGESFAL
jgi:hypothetical protein